MRSLVSIEQQSPRRPCDISYLPLPLLYHLSIGSRHRIQEIIKLEQMKLIFHFFECVADGWGVLRFSLHCLCHHFLIWLSNFLIIIKTHCQSTKFREDNVFTRVCLPVHRGGSPCDHYAWCIWPPFKDPLALIPASLTWDLGLPSPGPQTSDLRPPGPSLACLPQPSASNILWSSLETYSNLFIWGTHPVQMTSGGCY